MTPIRYAALLMVVVVLPGCDQPASPPPLPSASSAQVQSAPAPTVSKAALDAGKPAAPAKPVVEPATKAVTPPPSKPAAVAGKPKPKPKEPRVPLDLSLGDDVFDGLLLDSSDDLPTTLLPPLFGDKVAPEGPFQLNGKLITNDRTDSYLDSVEGAALQFEFKN